MNTFVLSSELILVDSGSDENGANATDPGGDSVQVMHAADIDESDLLLEIGANMGETESTYVTGDHTDQESKHGLGDHISTGTDGHASGQSCIEHDFDVELVGGESGGDTGGKGGRDNGKIGVDLSSSHWGSFGNGGVERGPVHEQKDRPDKSHQVGDVTTSVALVVDGFLALHEVRHGKSEIGPEHVDHHGASDIGSFEAHDNQGFVESPEEGFQSGDDQKLGKAHTAQNDTEGDQVHSSGEIGVDQVIVFQFNHVESAFESLVPESGEEDGQQDYVTGN